MKFSEAWLREWTTCEWNTQQLTEQLTMAGLEVGSVESVTASPVDNIFDLELTPNRGDCLSILGVAREVSALSATSIKSWTPPAITASNQEKYIVQVEAPHACPRYTGRLIKNIRTDAVTPAWMQHRLQQVGVRLISPVVDICNYVMWELGQPLHAFDVATLEGNLVVRYANAGESLTLLDGQTITLKPDSLVIADEKKALALAGIMGGQESGVTDGTTSVFIESAFFAPVAIAGRARQYGLSTDASHRFERGVDPELPAVALARVTQLILEVTGGTAGPVIEQLSVEHLPAPKNIALTRQQVQRVLGITLPDATIHNILVRLGMQLQSTEQGWQVTVPTYRTDVVRSVDLIEEIARVHGYSQLPTHRPVVPLVCNAHSEQMVTLPTVSRALLDRGYQEVITYSFVEPSLQQRLFPTLPGLALTNPISADMSVMRVSLWPGLIQAVLYNQHRQQGRIRFFETGLRFVPSQNLLQERVIAGIVTGEVYPEQWSIPKRKLDFFDVKGDVESLLQLTGHGAEFQFMAAEHSALHPKQSAKVVFGNTEVGYVGALHPSIVHALELKGPVFLFELVLTAIESGAVPAFQGLSKFPSIRRDIAIVVDDNILAESIRDTVVKAAGNLLNTAHIFDVYQGEGVPSGKKSIAIGLVLRHPMRTLVDNEVNAVVNEVVSILAEKFNATMRE